MNKFLKVIVIGSFAFVAIALGLVAFIFFKLPTAKSLSQKVKQALPSSDKKEGPIVVPNVTGEAIKASPNAEISKQETEAIADEKLNEAVFDDLVSDQSPMSNFCGSLKNAKVGTFSEKDFYDSFQNSLSVEKQDPRIQAAKPFFRYVMRLPKMRELVSEVDSAPDREDQGLVEKAKFYGLAYSALSEMKSHQQDIEAVLDRGYLFIGLNNLIAKKPELVNDSRIQNFCASTETLFNQSSPVDFDREKNDFIVLLKDSGVKPAEIDFNPDYKTKLDFSFTQNSLSMQGGWLDDILKPEADDDGPETAEVPTSSDKVTR